jgi:hypothetical protein
LLWSHLAPNTLFNPFLFHFIQVPNWGSSEFYCWKVRGCCWALHQCKAPYQVGSLG